MLAGGKVLKLCKEADQRRADIIKKMNLEVENGVATPCEEEKALEIEANRVDLE